VQPSDADSYNVSVTNVVGTVASNAAQLSVNVPVSFTTQPVDRTVNPGTAATFSVVAAGTAPFTYQWRKAGTPIAGATSASYTIASAQASHAADYDVVVTNVVGSATSASATLSVNTPVSITAQPVGGAVNPGASLSLSVTATGTEPITYQWRRAGSPISGGTGATYTILAAGLSDAGYYDVRVTNVVGTVTSGSASVSLNSIATITTQPVARAVNPGAPATFTVAATGTAPLTYQWFRDSDEVVGGTSATLSIPSAQAVDAGSYSVKVTNIVGVTTSNSALLSLNVPVSITTQPGSLAVNSGTVASFSVVAAGTAPFTYQWRKNGTPISGATGATFTIPSAQPSNAANYDVIVTNVVGPVTSAAAALSINAPVSIATQPAGLAVNPGTPASFSVVAAGTAPFTYQWRKGGIPIDGGTQDVYTIPSAQFTDAGTFDVVVRNVAGVATSAGAVLMVNVPVSVATQPVGATVNPGVTTTFKVTAAGTPPFTYQWRKDGVDISGGTSSSFTVVSAKAVDAGSYTVEISNVAGRVTSDSAVFSVNAPVSFDTQPASVTVNPGQPVSFTVVPAGTPPFTYQWRKNGTAISGATASTFAFGAALGTDSGNYDVLVTNIVGTGTSAVATLVVNTPVAITAQPASVAVNPGATASLSVTATGARPITYQWHNGSGPIAGGTAAVLEIPNVQTSDAGPYHVVVTNPLSSVTSSTATLALNSPVNITTQPASLTVGLNGLAVLTVAATGTTPITYQWRKDGVPISGATRSTLSITSAKATDDATYDVLVTNPVGTVTSAPAVLTVNTPAVITTPPAALTVNPGASATFSVVATGTAPLSYQWRRGGVNIAGGTASTYTIPSASASDAWKYDVVVSNIMGATISASASLTVNAPVSIVSQPANTGVVAGGTAVLSVLATGTSPLSYQWLKDGTPIAGGTSASLSIFPAQASDAGSYLVEITNVVGLVSSSAAALTIYTPLSITSQPSALNLNEGAAAAFSVVAAGSGPISYQWRKDGVAIAGGSSATLAIASVQTLDAGSYDVTLSSPAGSLTSDPAALTVNTPPVIKTHPVSLAVIQTAKVNLSVTATGAAPMSYRWLKDGVALSGGTSSSFTIPSMSAADSGKYSVEVTNALGSVTSNEAALTLTSGPMILTQPVGLAVNAGRSATLSVDAAGPVSSGTITYQWRKNGIAISGATARSYMVRSMQASSVGSYDVLVKNGSGSILSDVVQLTLNSPVTITTQPAPAMVNAGASTTLRVAVAGTAPFTYQWRRNGISVPGATSSVYTLPNAQSSNVGSYTVTVSNVVGSVTSAAATVALNVPVRISTQPLSAGINPNSSRTLSVVATGTAPIRYQWRRNGVALLGATSASYTLANAGLENLGIYDVVLTNPAGSVTSTPAVITLNTGLTLLTHPASTKVNPGKSVSLSVTANGTLPITYQWRKDGVLLKGATAATYSLASAQTVNSGSYDVVVTNPVGSVTSKVAVLSLNAPVAITSQPAAVVVNPFASSLLSVTATGTAPLTYQWRKDGVAIPGATASTYAVSATQTRDVGTYDVVVSNIVGSAVSIPAKIALNSAVTLTSQPSNVSLSIGGTLTWSVVATGTAPITYQWRKDGVPIPNATSAKYSITAARLSDAGLYDVSATNIVGTVSSNPAVLTLHTPVSISVPPASVAVNPRAVLSLSVTATGSAPITYQWRRNGVALAGATSASYTVASVAAANAGSYDVIVSNVVGSVTSAAAAVAVNTPVTITSQPVGGNVNPGASRTFSVTATGTAPLTYQWRRNKVTIPGATSASFTITNAQDADATGYDVVVSNPVDFRDEQHRRAWAQRARDHSHPASGR
jgi:hypothetical protein